MFLLVRTLWGAGTLVGIGLAAVAAEVVLLAGDWGLSRRYNASMKLPRARLLGELGRFSFTEMSYSW